MRGGGKGGSAVGDLETVVRWVQELAVDPVTVAEMEAIACRGMTRGGHGWLGGGRFDTP
jgi:hypothetical protein